MFWFTISAPEELNIFPSRRFHPNDVIYFQLESDILNSRLHEAILFIYVRPYNLTSQIFRELKIFRIIKSHYEQEYTYNVIADITKKIPLTAKDTGQWYRLNMTSVVEKWMAHCNHDCQHGHENYGLYINFKDFEANNIAVIRPSLKDEDAYVSMLVFIILLCWDQPLPMRGYHCQYNCLEILCFCTVCTPGNKVLSPDFWTYGSSELENFCCRKKIFTIQIIFFEDFDFILLYFST